MDWILNKIKDRENRLGYRRSLLLIAKFTKFIFVLVDIASDIYYISTVRYFNKIIYYLSILSFCALPAIIYFYSFHLYYISYNDVKSKAKMRIFLFFWIIFGPFICFCYPFTIALENFIPKRLAQISTFASLEYFYEALPQLCIQIYNNNQNDSWETISYISCTLSSISLILGLFQLTKSKFDLDYSSFLNQIELCTVKNVKVRCDHARNPVETAEKTNLVVNKVDLDQILVNLDQNSKEDLYIIDIPEKFIKYKFYELLDTDKLVLEKKYDLILKDQYSRQAHSFVEDCLKEELEKYSLRLEKIELLARCCKPLGFYVFTKMVLVFAILVFNIFYVIFAEFESEYKRFLLIFLLGWYYKHSISNIQELESHFHIKYLAIFRVLIITDFYNLVYLLYFTEPKIKKPILTEIFHFPYFWVILIGFQISNYNDNKNKPGFHIAAITISSVYLLMPIFRIAVLYAKRIKNIQFF